MRLFCICFLDSVCVYKILVLSKVTSEVRRATILSWFVCSSAESHLQASVKKELKSDDVYHFLECEFEFE